MQGRVKLASELGTVHANARIKMHKSQEYMALALGVSKKTVQNWERGISMPTLLQSIEWFQTLDLNPLTYYMELYSPHTYTLDVEKINKEFDEIVETLQPEIKSVFLYILKGKHGSSPYALLQLILAYLHTPLRMRLEEAILIYNAYNMDMQLGDTICPEDIKPDLEVLAQAIHKAQESVLKREKCYSETY